MRRKAVASPGWPFQQVVDEFYSQPPALPAKFSWGRPRPGDFCQVATLKMDWVRDYCVEKVLEVVVRWQVKHPEVLAVNPTMVVKKRVKAGEAMLEVEWVKTCPPCLCSTSKYPCIMPSTFTACVPTVDFAESFSVVMNSFQAKVDAKEAAKKKPKSKRGKENRCLNEVPHGEGLENGKTKKGRSKQKLDQKQPKISDFVQSDAERPITECEKLERPKNIVFKKLLSNDKAFNNKVISTKMLTPKETEPAKAAEYDKSLVVEESGDSFVLRPAPSYASEAKQSRAFDISSLTDSVRHLMDSGDDSDLSDIIDDIIGAAKREPQKSKGKMSSVTDVKVVT